MIISFTKAQALGNDFIIIPNASILKEIDHERLVHLIQHIANRRLGIGCDQVIFIEESEPSGTQYPPTYTLRFFNADGSEAESCGNGTRACAEYIYQMTHITSITCITHGGTIYTTRTSNNLISLRVPYKIGNSIPAELDTFITNELSHTSYIPLLHPMYITIGNPHIVIHISHHQLISEWGPKIERHPYFTHGVNVNFITGIDHNHIRLTVWERGVGLTPACGTGAIASALVCMQQGKVDDHIPVYVHQPGGMLTVIKHAHDIEQIGPAICVYNGTMSL